MPSTHTLEAAPELAMHDLGPLAWVLDELRKSLDGATKAMHRFVRDAELARGSELSELDTSHLRVARQQLHQAVGALEMVGMPAPAQLLHAMESVVQKYVQRPELCSDDAANRIERAGFALAEYLEGVLKGKASSSVALFPQYRAVQELAGAERIHPADLWPVPWRWLPVALDSAVRPLHYVPEVRAVLDQSVLKIVKTADPQAAAKLAQVCAALSVGQTALEARSFWAIAAGYFEAMGQALLPADIYTKRTASRILQQYAAMARGDAGPSERLAQDLVFFCAQAKPLPDQEAKALSAVRAAYGLTQSEAVDYETVQFGRFDPAQLALARKRVAAAAETWSALAGGDTARLPQAGEQFGAVAESVLKLHPSNGALAKALTGAVEASVRSGAAPSAALAMEVATAVLYLESAYEDLDPTDDRMVERGNRLASRLQQVRDGGAPEPLETWMEELYRRVSDRQTMGSVVDELRSALGEVETALDQFFRNPADTSPLRDAPVRLGQMRGVFSVLGLDQPSLATLRMRASVDRLLAGEVDLATARAGLFEQLGNSLGALGLLIDMLSYQRAMAKKLFVYDEAAGEFRPLMGRERTPVPEAAPPGAVAPLPEVAPAAPVDEAEAEITQPGAVAAVPAPPPPEPEPDEDDQELLEIFLDEAREVVGAGLAAVRQLHEDPSNLAEQTTLRRAFHTLKGSSRMVGLNDFGEAAWAFEQMLNAWLAEQKPASQDLMTLSQDGMTAFGRWIEDIAGKTGVAWSAAEFRQAADAQRLQGQLLPLRTPAVPTEAQAEGPAPEPTAMPDFAATMVHDDLVPPTQTASPEPELQPEPHLDFAATQTFNLGAERKAEPPAASAAVDPSAYDLGDFDFGDASDSAAAQGPETVRGAEPAIELDFPPEAGDVLEPDVLQALAPEPESLSEPASVPEPEPIWDEAPEPAPEPAPAAAAAPDEQTKVIGNLHLSIPLYNVYLNEADEWSRRLITELSEWALELHKPVPDNAVALAHSLAGSSGTVGFTALAEVARALEYALDHVKLHRQGNAQFAQAFCDAAEDIRRLLHQFAAGFLKGSDAAVLAALKAISALDFPPVPDEAYDDEEDVFDPQRLIVTTLSPLQRELPPVPPAEPTEPERTEPAATELITAETTLEAEPDIVVQDHLDADLFPIFQEESAELMPALGTALRQWVARPDNTSARGEALRVLHTLKGSARLAGALRLGEMAHRMESGIEKLGVEDLRTDLLEPLLSRMDTLQTALDALDLAPRSDIAQPPALAPDSVLPPDTPAEQKPAEQVAASATPVAPEQVTRSTPRGLPAHSVRVRAQLLDRMVNQAGEVMISRSRLDNRIVQMRSALTELTGNLERLRSQLRDVEVQAESQMQSRMAQSRDDAEDFDPLEFDRFTRVQELTRMMAESVNDVATVQRNMQRAVEGAEDDLIAQGRQARALQRDVLRTRMVEFDSITERLYGVVRQSAKETGKQVKLDIVGGTIEMDRGVLDRMTPAFEHILRNAIAHGIESAEVRHVASKPPVGSVRITVHQESNDVVVAFADDGGGLQLEKIRAKAIANKLIAPDAVLSDAAAAQLLFTPGFSTASEVTELSGRGIGMDVVMNELNGLGGRVETFTEAGKGTIFKLVLPLTTAVTQVVLLRMGDFSIGVPANLMETVLRAPAADVESAYQRGTYRWGGQDIAFYWGGALLQGSGRSTDPQARNLPVAIFRSAGQRLALHVDEVLGNREVVVKNLGPQLAHMPGLSGMSVLASGAVVLIYNPVALATVYGAQARTMSAQTATAPAATNTAAAVAQLNASQAQAPLVLVVDDSITVRRVTQRLLKREGFRVALANDGVHALEVLRQEKPAVVLSDIEMPRMDGFELVRNIRALEDLSDLPVIMITSRIAQKHRDHAQELGVDHYLGKPYAEDELLALVRSYCAEPVSE